MSLKHVKQPYCMETVCVIGHKMLRDATFMMIEIVGAPHFVVALWHCVMLTTILNCSEKCGFN